MSEGNKYAMDIDAFLDHTASGGGGGGTAYFRKWKEAGRAIVWLNKEAGFIAKWAHGWPRCVELKDRETSEKRIEVWAGSWNCHETEAVLKRQNFRDERDSRETPPERCPLCKLIEVVRALVATGELKLWDPVFKFKGSSDRYDVTLTAGGIYNAFRTDGKGALSEKVQAECRKHGVRFNDAWKENTKARCGYTFVIVDNAHPENGVQIADEREALGQKMQRAIRDEIDRRGGGDRGRLLGNPLRTPYPFLWQYDDNESFSDKYRVVALTDGEPKLTDEIKELIEGPAPDLDRHMRPGNVKQLRADMERHAVIKLPFDEIFEAFDDAEEEGADADKPPFDPDDDNPLTEAIRSVNAARVTVPDVREAAPATSDDEFECDHCGGVLKGTDFTCPHCGACFDPDGGFISRPCNECKTQVPIEGDGPRYICPKCGAIHAEVDGKWTSTPIAAGPPVRRSRSKATAKVTNEDPIPFGGKR